MKAGESTTVFFNHEWWSLPIGQVVESKVDELGLLVKIVFVDTENDPNEADLEQIIRRIAQGVIKTFSIGFLPTETTKEYEEDQDGFRRLVRRVFEDIHLLEVSVVSIPANAEARMTEVSVKNFFSSLKSPTSDSEQKQATPSVVTKRLTKRGKNMEDHEINALVNERVASSVTKAMESFFAMQEAKQKELQAAETIKSLEAKVASLTKPSDKEDSTATLLKAITDLTATVSEMKSSGIKVLGARKGSVKTPAKDDLDDNGDDDVDTEGKGLSVKELKEIAFEDDDNILYKAIWVFESKTPEAKSYLASLSKEEREIVEKVYEEAVIADGVVKTLNS